MIYWLDMDIVQKLGLPEHLFGKLSQPGTMKCGK